MSFPLFNHTSSRPVIRVASSGHNPFAYVRTTQISSASLSLNETSSSSSIQPMTFTLFPLLPTELQLYIWEMIFSERRVIPVYVAPFIHTSLGGLPAYMIPSSPSSVHGVPAHSIPSSYLATGVPVQISPRTQTSACALVRYLRPSSGPLDGEVHTRPLPSLESAPYVCKSTFEIYNRRYKRMLLMRCDRKLVEVKFNPRQDMIFFKMGLSSKMQTCLSLEAFVKFQPAAAKCLRRIAVETIGAVENFVAVLMRFESLEQLLVVLPMFNNYNGFEHRYSDAADNVGRYNQRAWELGLSIQGTGDMEDLKWRVEEVIRRELERVKAERWMDWKLPCVRVVEQWENLLET
ncbi:hypothetical protein BKA65DRAFT_560059 [Rhexocercosporidium sp. MPI-PUGE-AT-0058]|nr:hypothetical protein BKA65DRAFT_560059 [Rhexocercosporidium sp. MPI-PUGE-AT-0058]